MIKLSTRAVWKPRSWRKLAEPQMREWKHAQWAIDPRCHYCGVVTALKREDRKARPMDRATVDHKRSKKHFETPDAFNQVDNFALACHRCNNEKGDMDYNEFVALMREKT